MTSDLEQRLTTREPAESGEPSIAQLLERMTPQLQRALPRHLDADRLVRIATTEFRRNPDLMLCSTESLLGALMWAAQLGLEPGPMGEVYLIPRREHGQMHVQFELGYKGAVALMLRHPDVVSVSASGVWRGEPFTYREGFEPRLEHEPRGGDSERDRQSLHAAWAICNTTRKGVPPHVVIWPADVDRAQSSSPSGSRGSGPWVTDYAAMVRKTAVLRLVPFAPRSIELVQALNADGRIVPSELTSIDELAPPVIDAISDEAAPAPRLVSVPVEAPRETSAGGTDSGPLAAAAAAATDPPAVPLAETPISSPPPEPAAGPDDGGVGELVAFFTRHDEGKAFQGKLTPAVARGYLEAGSVDARRDAEGDLVAVITWALCKRRTDLPGRSGTLGVASKGDLRIEGLAGDEEAMAELLVARLAAWYETVELPARAWLENVRIGAEENAAVAAGFRPVAERIPGVWLYLLEPPTPGERPAAAADDEVAAREAAAAAQSNLTLHVAGLLDLCPLPLLERLGRALRRYGITPDVTSLAARFGAELADARSLEGLVERLEGAAEFRGFIDEQGQSQETIE